MSAPEEGVIGLYPGSFNPMHKGHVSIAERAAGVMSKLYVAVAFNPDKTYEFSPEERVAMAEESLAHIPNLGGVLSFPDGLTVDHALDLGATTMIRGERSVDDFLEEVQLNGLNTYLQEVIGIRPGGSRFVETQTFHVGGSQPEGELSHDLLSSTTVRQLMYMKGVKHREERIRPMVPEPVFEVVLAHMAAAKEAAARKAAEEAAAAAGEASEEPQPSK